MYRNSQILPGYGDPVFFAGRYYPPTDSPRAASDDIEAAMNDTDPDAPVPSLGHHPQGGAYEETFPLHEVVMEAIGNDDASEAAFVALLRLDMPELRALRAAASKYWIHGHADLLDEIRCGVDV